jgi:hypothetical protein
MTRDDLLAAALAAGLEPADFDKAVHEAKAEEASTVNNAGLEAQLDFLIEAYGLEATRSLLEKAAYERSEDARGGQANHSEAS